MSLNAMEQLQAFVDYERKHSPDKKHVAEFALEEIERLRKLLAAAPQPPEVDQWLPPIERDERMDRTYIPMPGGWEIQTKGKGSTFRICNTKAHERWPVLDETLHRHLEQMALDARASVLGQITPNPEGV